MPPLAASLVRPSDTLSDVVRNYELHGFPSRFVARSGGNVRCMSCGRDHPARWVKLLALHRLEGKGTPGESVLAAVECPACEERGTLALSFGQAGTTEDRLVLSLVADHRDEPLGIAIRPGV